MPTRNTFSMGSSCHWSENVWAYKGEDGSGGDGARIRQGRAAAAAPSLPREGCGGRRTTARGLARDPGAGGAGRGARRKRPGRYDKASRPPASATAATMKDTASAGTSRAQAGSSFTSPPPIQRRVQKKNSAANSADDSSTDSKASPDAMRVARPKPAMNAHTGFGTRRGHQVRQGDERQGGDGQQRGDLGGCVHRHPYESLHGRLRLADDSLDGPPRPSPASPGPPPSGSERDQTHGSRNRNQKSPKASAEVGHRDDHGNADKAGQQAVLQGSNPVLIALQDAKRLGLDAKVLDCSHWLTRSRCCRTAPVDCRARGTTA